MKNNNNVSDQRSLLCFANDEIIWGNNRPFLQLDCIKYTMLIKFHETMVHHRLMQSIIMMIQIIQIIIQIAASLNATYNINLYKTSLICCWCIFSTSRLLPQQSRFPKKTIQTQDDKNEENKKIAIFFEQSLAELMSQCK